VPSSVISRFVSLSQLVHTTLRITKNPDDINDKTITPDFLKTKIFLACKSEENGSKGGKVFDTAIRDVSKRFVQAGNINKEKSTGRLRI
jgi:hypothetical protein